MIAPKTVATRIEGFQKAWKTLRPAKSFSGLTLEQFNTQVKPSQEAREEIDRLEKETLQQVVLRTKADQASLALMKRLANAIKGDADEGEDSDFYGAVGYVRTSHRKSGLHRSKKVIPLAKAA